MGFVLEYMAGMWAAAGAEAPSSLEENYQRWLRSMRDRIDSELASEERAAEWLRKTLPRLEEDYRKSADGKVDDEMPEDCKLQKLKYSVLETMLREAEAEAGVRRIREKQEERLRRRKYLAATGAMLALCAVFVVYGVLIPSDDMSMSEFVDFMCEFVDFMCE